MILRTERLFLRPLAMSDAPALFAARGDPEVMRWWDWPAQNNLAELESIIADHDAPRREGSVLWWVAALTPDGPAIGECDLSEIDARHRRAEIGFLFARAHWGKGYGREAAQATLDHGFGALGLARLYARIHAGNERSRRLLERLGFAFEGRMRSHIERDGERRDCLIYGMSRDDAG